VKDGHALARGESGISLLAQALKAAVSMAP
jgi:hypothetical protein